MKKISIIYGLIFCCISTYCMNNSTVAVHLTGNGNEIIKKVPKKYVDLSRVLKDQMENVGSDTCSIPMERISADTFKEIINICPTMFDLLNSSDVIKQQAAKSLKDLLEEKNDQELVVLANAADYLDIPTLLSYVVSAIAEKIKKNKKDYAQQYKKNTCSFVFNDLNLEINKKVARIFGVSLTKTMSAGLFDKILNGTEKINTVIFSFDGKKVISISDDNKNIKVWDIATGKCKKLTGHTNEVCTIDVSKDGNYIASGAKDQNIILWDAKTLKYLKKLTGHTSEIRTLSFSLNNPRIASGSADCTIKIWDIDSGNCIMSISNTALVTLIKFLPDENLITSDWGHTINVWDSSTGKPIKTIKSLEKDQHINSICFSSKGKVASGSYGIMIWDKNNHQKSVCVKFLGEHKKIIRSMDFSPDGTKIVSSCGNEMKIWNINSGRRVNKVEHSGRINSVKFSPDSKQIVSGSDDGKINVWRLNFNSIPDYLEE